MLIIPTYTAPDSYGGTGLFSSKFLPAGSLIWVFNAYIDVFFSVSGYNALAPDLRAKIEKYVYPGVKNRVAGLLYSLDNDRFTNHSFAPNSRYIHTSGGQKRLRSWETYDISRTRIYASRNIVAGEEITANYYDFAPGDLPDFYSQLPSYAFLRDLVA